MRGQWLTWRAVLLGSALTLAGCTADTAETGSPAAVARSGTADGAHAQAAPGGIVRSGDSFAMMADQYQTRSGPYAATGASAWVRPAPAPAFVLSGPLPAAAPAAPPPAAVANRQPAPAPAAPPASEIVRPEAAQPETPQAPAAAAPNAAVRTAGLALFNNYSCGACHTLADAGAAGSIGPSFDRNPRLTKAYAVEVISDGRGAMPSFAGQMSPEQIDQVAEYIVQFARK